VLYTREITTSGLHTIKIKDGATTGSADLNVLYQTGIAINAYHAFCGFAVISAPAAGTRTFSLTGTASAGTMTVGGTGHFVVELI
jgi:hypothetical protein